MNKRSHSKVSRLASAVAVVLLIAFLFAAIGKTLAYFNTGANNNEIYVINTNILKDHHPKIVWDQDEIVDGRIVNDYMRAELEKAYIEAWYVANMSFANKDATHLKDYFMDNALSRLIEEVEDSSSYTLHQTELSHNLQLHHFTLDNQLAAFSDRGVRVKRQILNEQGELIIKDDQVFDIDVVMSLDDGRWRIKHFVKTIKYTFNEGLPVSSDQKLIAHLDNMRGVNYYPASTPWFEFWEGFDQDTIMKDLSLAKASNFNSVRIFLQYSVFGEAQVKVEMLDKLQIFLDIAAQKDIKVIVSLFDFPKSYELMQYSATDRHLESILTRFKDHRAILAWDIKNEPDLDFDNYGMQTVTDWLTFAVSQARNYDPNHLITIGWSDASAAHIMNDELDFVSFHFYKKAEELAIVIENLKSKTKDKKLVLGEFGQSSLNSIWTMFNRSEKKQAKYYSDILSVLSEEEVSYISWSLKDFEVAPTEVFGRKPWISQPQKHYGLYRSDGTEKPVLAVLKK